jgi:hypothetical protein
MGASDFLKGAAVGAGLLYCFDETQGARRRARITEQLGKFAGAIEHEAGIGLRDLEHRLMGVLHDARLMLGEAGEVEGRVLEARVRAALGHACSHPHAIDVLAREDGSVELAGDVRAEEAEALIEAVRRVRGVHAIDDDLTRHADDENFPPLQGGMIKPRGGAMARPATRLLAGSAALGALAWLAPRLTMRIVGLFVIGAAARSSAQKRSRRAPQPAAPQDQAPVFSAK